MALNRLSTSWPRVLIVEFVESPVCAELEAVSVSNVVSALWAAAILLLDRAVEVVERNSVRGLLMLLPGGDNCCSSARYFPVSAVFPERMEDIRAASALSYCS